MFSTIFDIIFFLTLCHLICIVNDQHKNNTLYVP